MTVMDHSVYSKINIHDAIIVNIWIIDNILHYKHVMIKNYYSYKQINKQDKKQLFSYSIPILKM